MITVSQSAELWAVTPDAEALIDRCARVSHQSDDRSGTDTVPFIRRLISVGHLSVLEHASATIAFITDRGVSHELVRHRLCAFTQESTRYCRYADGIRIVVPPGLDVDAIIHDIAEDLYCDLLDDDVKPEIARAVLPTCLATQIVVTANLRQWRHMLTVRLHPSAHPQMRELMRMAGRILLAECPTVFEEFRDIC